MDLVFSLIEANSAIIIIAMAIVLLIVAISYVCYSKYNKIIK